MIVNERRGRLNDNSVESLVVLREAYLNEMWPKCNIIASSDNHHNQPAQLQELVSMASIAES